MRSLSSFFDFFLDRYPNAERLGVPVARWRQSIYRTVFETRTPMGKKFERYLTLAIVCSLLAMMAHSIPSVANSPMIYALRAVEIVFTLAFTVEYVLRIISIRKPWRYVFSFYGIVDLLAIVPTYLSIFYAEASFFAAIRALRLIRTFHVFPILRGFLREYMLLGRALRNSARKIFVFLSVVAVIVFVMGSLIFIIEGPEHGFTSVPIGIYWAISTVTTVGYGDLTPSTPLGRMFASIMMLLGWGILAVPTGLVGAELSRAAMPSREAFSASNVLFCDGCGLEQHEDDARFCRHCGARLMQLNDAPDSSSTADASASMKDAPSFFAAGTAKNTDSKQDISQQTAAVTGTTASQHDGAVASHARRDSTAASSATSDHSTTA